MLPKTYHFSFIYSVNKYSLKIQVCGMTLGGATSTCVHQAGLHGKLAPVWVLFPPLKFY